METQTQNSITPVRRNFILMDESDWDEKFKPIANHINPDSTTYTLTIEGQPKDCAFETYGTDLDYVKEMADKEPGRVWTVLDCDGQTIISNGYQHVNRMYYLITEVPCPEGVDIEAKELLTCLDVTCKLKFKPVVAYEDLNKKIQALFQEFLNTKLREHPDLMDEDSEESLMLDSTLQVSRGFELNDLYVKQPNACPYCGSEDIETAGQMESDTGIAWQEVHCNNCHADWKDQYELTGYSAD